MKWTKEKVFEESKKYTSRGNFQKGSSSAYQKALKENWIDDMLWLKSEKKPCGYWKNKNNVLEESKKYKFLKDFREKSGGAYSAAADGGYLNEMTWLVKQEQLSNGYWNSYEHCYEVAKKCKSKAELKKLYSAAYHKARIMKWLNDYTWFDRMPLSAKREYLIYAYKHDKTKSAYVGLTKLYRLKQRHKEHKFGHIKDGKRKYDSVYRFFQKLGEEIPEPTILKKSLLAEEAQFLEEFYKKQYENEGWKMINIAKCGSLGAYSKWNSNNCKIESKKYKSKTEFARNNPSAYEYARINNLLGGYTWLKEKYKPNGYWNNYERCYEEAKKYEYVKEFIEKSVSAYNSAFRHKWLKDYKWLKITRKPKNYWDFKKCEEAFKECNNNRVYFEKKYPGASRISRKKKWFNLFK